MTTNGLALSRWAAAGRGDRQTEHEQSADDLCGLGHRDGEDEEEDDAEEPGGNTSGPGHIGVDGGKEERAPDGRQDDSHNHRDDAEQHDLARADAEDVAEQDVQGLAGVAVVVAEEEDAESEPGRQDHADGRIALGGPLAEQADEAGHNECADECAGERVVGDQQPGHGTGECELTRPMYGEGHGAGDDERSDQAAADRHEEGRFESVLGEAELEVEPDTHQWALVSKWPGPWPWCACAPGSVGSSSSALTTR